MITRSIRCTSILWRRCSRRFVNAVSFTILSRCLLVRRFVQFLFVIAVVSIGAEDPFPTWRIAVYEFCKANLQHTAWGVAHCERNFILALALAKDEGLKPDEDVLYAATFLHDLGTFAPYLREEVDHGE